MPNKGKVPSVVLIVLVLISLLLAAGAFYFLQKEKVKNLALVDELEDVRTKEKIIESKLEDSKETVTQLQTDLGKANSEIDFLKQELDKEKQAAQDTLVQLEQVKVELDEYKKSRAEIEQRLAKKEEEFKKLNTQLKDTEEKRSRLEGKLREIEEAESQRVELGTIVVGQQEPVVSDTYSPRDISGYASSLEGKILVVNKDYDFAVINLGSKDGVQVSDIFSIYHSNKYIGDIKIERVHESMAAANFISPDIKNKVREGDKVVSKNK